MYSRRIEYPPKPPGRSRTRVAQFVAAVAVVMAATLSGLVATGPLGISPAGAETVSPPAEPGPPTAETTTDPVPATAPISSANARYIVASYQELLGRTADHGGVDYQLNQITAGGERARLVLAYSMLFSAEGARQEVDRAYQELLGRSTDPTGATYWTNHLTGHGVLDLRVLLLASDEYAGTAGGTDQAWLAALYQDVLGRPLDAEGQTYWLGLRTAGVARASIAGAIYQSDEALGRRTDAYFTDVLSRQPSATERQTGQSILATQGERYLRAHLWASDEAYETHLQAAWS